MSGASAIHPTNYITILGVPSEIWQKKEQARTTLFGQFGVRWCLCGAMQRNLRTNYGKQFAESLLNKRMTKYGHDYVLSPNLQMRYSLDPHDVVCRSNFELIFKKTNFQPACVKPTSVERLIERGWTSGHDPQHMDMNK